MSPFYAERAVKQTSSLHVFSVFWLGEQLTLIRQTRMQQKQHLDLGWCLSHEVGT